ncbi:hypothetical protein H1C71_015196 [Ictidomys tridecemlineatus]|nr:hypothetical protein H1C71_015196 [Ictidomys tridecemlineatus]
MIQTFPRRGRQKESLRATLQLILVKKQITKKQNLKNMAESPPPPLQPIPRDLHAADTCRGRWTPGQPRDKGPGDVITVRKCGLGRAGWQLRGTRAQAPSSEKARLPSHPQRSRWREEHPVESSQPFPSAPAHVPSVPSRGHEAARKAGDIVLDGWLCLLTHPAVEETKEAWKWGVRNRCSATHPPGGCQHPHTLLSLGFEHTWLLCMGWPCSESRICG